MTKLEYVVAATSVPALFVAVAIDPALIGPIAVLCLVGIIVIIAISGMRRDYPTTTPTEGEE